MSAAGSAASSILDKALWQVTAPDRPAGKALDAELACDVAVVGAGFTGLRAALALAEAGSKVAVFDAGDVGHGAAGRSGGQVNPMLPMVRPGGSLRRAVGETYLDTPHQSLAGLPPTSSSTWCDATRSSATRASTAGYAPIIVPAARDRARETAREWNALGAGFTFLDGAEVRRP